MTLTPMAADPVRGSLAGFKITCDCCRYEQTCSIETLAREWAREHVAFPAGAFKRKGRK